MLSSLSSGSFSAAVVALVTTLALVFMARFARSSPENHTFLLFGALTVAPVSGAIAITVDVVNGNGMFAPTWFTLGLALIAWFTAWVLLLNREWSAAEPLELAE